jgi:hypothetical protein
LNQQFDIILGVISLTGAVAGLLQYAEYSKKLRTGVSLDQRQINHLQRLKTIAILTAIGCAASALLMIFFS